MRVRMFRNKNGTFNILTEPKAWTGLPKVNSINVQKADIGAVVLPLALAEDVAKTRIRAAREAPLEA